MSVRASHELVSIQWRDLQVTTKNGRRLLHGINGIALPGEVIALMGASGAGKTTLMNTLLHRNLGGLVVDGQILVNGQNIGKGVTNVSAYVQQEDLFVGTLTVREHLMIQAKMKLPSSFTQSMRAARVEEVMKEMLLEGPQSSRIGVPGIVKGISGGEMKRLSFATEMLSNPPILFCDEPTTGLDSHMAEVVVKTLDSLAGDKGKTVICTIHQPSSEVFEIFDKVVFLAQGRVAFHGPPDDAVWFFAKCGYILPDHMNPADHFIDTLAIWPDKADECKKRAEEICDKFAVSRYAEELEAQMKEFQKPKSLCPHRGARFPDLVSALFLSYNCTIRKVFAAFQLQLHDKESFCSKHL